MSTEEIKAIMERAVRTEESSYSLYLTASRRVKDPGARAGLADLAEEERKHKEKLERLLTGNLEWAVSVGRKGAVKDLRISEVLESRPITEKSDLRDVLAFAIKREEATGIFYAQMAALADPGPVRDVFHLLAREEARHKQVVEEIYEQDVYQDF